MNHQAEQSIAGDDDHLLVQQVLQGKQHAYALLVNRHQDTISRQVLGFSRDPLEREELTQDVFVEAYQGLSSFRADAPFLHWLRRIATNICYAHLRRRAKRDREFPLEDFDMPAQDIKTMDAELAADLLFALLARLRHDDRCLLTTYYFEQLSMEEIGQRLGIQAKAVKMRLSRARKKLRAVVKKADLENFLND